MDAQVSPPTQSPPPDIIILGRQIALGPMSHTLLPLYQRWSNDFGVTRTMRLAAPATAEQLAADYDRATHDEHSVSFTIYDRVTWRPIGNTAWIALDWHARTAEFILYLGEADYRGHGIGTEVTGLMLNYAFDTLGLHSVMLRVYSFNLAGQRAYARAGFREFGRRREAKMMGGARWDVVYMECLSTEYAATANGAMRDHATPATSPGGTQARGVRAAGESDSA